MLKRRGPDSFEIVNIDVEHNGMSTLYFAASVLSLRGNQKVIRQPIVDQGNFLLWNGEIYTSDLIRFDNRNDNDGLALLDHLRAVDNENEIVNFLSSIKGPYAFVYYTGKTKSIYYGRDRVGRRSLLVHMPNTGLDDYLFALSSVKINGIGNYRQYEFDELNANGVYKIDLTEQFASPKWVQLIEWSELSAFNECLNEAFDEAKFKSIYDEFTRLMRQSMIRRLCPLPRLCKHCLITNMAKSKFDDAMASKCTHAKVALLFSGGLDSAVLAALMDELLPENEEIDLLNVAFEQKAQQPFQVPDRVSGLKTLHELDKNRKWNFVEINVTQMELKECRDMFIKDLIYPLDTVLDDSIGCAMWFASRGTGALGSVSYQSNAEIILLGIGADEQLGGYSRHRTRYQADGPNGLINELKMEMKRIAERNLGRDDRILSHHGKESRLPYLDEDLIDFLNGTELIYKCNLSLPKGVGDKYLLRTFAKDLGLSHASTLAKRAIQFGSRVAKLEGGKEKATDKCSRLKHQNDES